MVAPEESPPPTTSYTFHIEATTGPLLGETSLHERLCRGLLELDMDALEWLRVNIVDIEAE